MDNIKSLYDLLSWLIYAGGSILVASWVLDKIPSFGALPPEAKKYINMGVSVLLALGAFALITYVPTEIFALLDPWFKIVGGVVILYAGQQAMHQLTK